HAAADSPAFAHRGTLLKLAAFSLSAALVPILTYFYTLDYFGGSSTKSAIAAVVAANVIMFGYVAVAFAEDRAESKQKLEPASSRRVHHVQAVPWFHIHLRPDSAEEEEDILESDASTKYISYRHDKDAYEIKYARTCASAERALSQLSKTIALLHLFHMESFPGALRTFLEDASLHKAGVNVTGDATRLSRDYGVKPVGLVELGVNARQRVSDLAGIRRPTLAMLTEELLGKTLEKGPVRVGNWERTNLTEEQREYAANDAYVCYKIYRRLEVLKSPLTTVEEDKKKTAAILASAKEGTCATTEAADMTSLKQQVTASLGAEPTASAASKSGSTKESTAPAEVPIIEHDEGSAAAKTTSLKAARVPDDLAEAAKPLTRQKAVRQSTKARKGTAEAPDACSATEVGNDKVLVPAKPAVTEVTTTKSAPRRGRPPKTAALISMSTVPGPKGMVSDAAAVKAFGVSATASAATTRKHSSTVA
ncbi:hypothetical protein THASP1DRAFT_25451, partial [Thamnocephalis sphaerospora]